MKQLARPWCWVVGHVFDPEQAEKVWMSDLWNCARCGKRFATSRSVANYGITIPLSPKSEKEFRAMAKGFE